MLCYLLLLCINSLFRQVLPGCFACTHIHTHTSIVTWVNCSRLLLLLLAYKIECIWSTELYSPIECYKVCIRSVSATLQSAKRVCCQCYLLNIQNHMHEATLFCGQEGVSEKRDWHTYLHLSRAIHTYTHTHIHSNLFVCIFDLCLFVCVCNLCGIENFSVFDMSVHSHTHTHVLIHTQTDS